MALNSAVFTLLVFVALYLTIIEVFTVLFIITGMPEARARFQVISMLTNSGFTTKESESIVSIKKRRILAQITMLFGYTFGVVGVSMILNVIIKIPKSSANEMVVASGYLLVFLVLLFTIKRMPFCKRKFDRLIQKIGTRVMFSKKVNKFLVLDTYGDYVLAEMQVDYLPENLKEKTMEEIKLPTKHSIQLLMIYHNGVTNAQIKKDDVICEGDHVILFGRGKSISEVFNQQRSV